MLLLPEKKIVDFLDLFLKFPLFLVPSICVIQDSLKSWRRSSKGLHTHPIREYKAVDVLSTQKQTQFPRENWQLTFIYTWVYVCKTNICAEKMNKNFHSGIFLSIRFSLSAERIPVLYVQDASRALEVIICLVFMMRQRGTKTTCERLRYLEINLIKFPEPITCVAMQKVKEINFTKYWYCQDCLESAFYKHHAE